LAWFWLFWRSRCTGGHGGGRAAALLLAVLASPLVSSSLLRPLELRYAVVPPAEAPRTDAIVVLGGITGLQTHLGARFDLADSVERIDEAIRLYNAGGASRIVLTSGSVPPSGGKLQEGDHLHRYLRERLVPEEAVVHAAVVVRNTAEEADRVKALMDAKGWSRITLVTSAFHMPRSMMLFERAKVKAVPYPVDFRSFRDPNESLASVLFPRSDALSQTEMALREYYGMLYYKLVAR
jgi:uncharacterized SAM-binding protein YcdF (DUF218 family)